MQENIPFSPLINQFHTYLSYQILSLLVEQGKFFEKIKRNISQELLGILFIEWIQSKKL